MRDAGPPDRRPPPPAAALAGAAFVIAKAFAAGAFVVDAGVASAPFAVLGALAGAASDIVIVLALAALAIPLPRTATILAALLAGWALTGLFFLDAFGTPFSAAMLAYAVDVGGDLGFRRPLWLVLLGLVSWPALFVLLRRVERTLPPRAALSVAVAVLLTSFAARAFDAFALDHRGRHSGGSENALVTTLRSLQPRHDDTTARRPFDAPSQPPKDAAARAPVIVNAQQGRPRHVVVWLAESAGARYLSAFGSGDGTTPRLEGLLRDAVRFDRYRANTPVSAKAIFTTTCGLHAWPGAELETRQFPRIACPSLPETLQQHGYRSGLFHGGYFAFTDKLALLGERGYEVTVDGETVLNRDAFFHNGWGVDDRAVVDAGLRFLDDVRAQTPERPTLLTFIPLFPHYEYFLPPTVPRPYGEATLFDRYRNGLRYTDALFGHVVDAYAARGILEDTLFVFVGDHGEAFEQHPKNRIHGSFVYEENVHAPLVLVSPRLFGGAAQVSKRQGDHVDLVPTLLDALGIDAPSALQGRSLLASNFTHRPSILHAWHGEPLVGLVDDELKYIRNLQSGREAVYDLTRDPLERRDVSALHRAFAADARARLADFVERQQQLLTAYPTKPPPYLDRIWTRARAEVVAADVVTACVRRGEALHCPGVPGALSLVRTKVYNMERRCLRLHAPSQGTLRLHFDDVDAPRAVGFGLTDRARFARGQPVTAHFQVGAAPPFSFRVDDTFETAPGPVAITVEVEPAAGKNREACITFSP
jgi:arylsulfatase A-like enzyme